MHCGTAVIGPWSTCATCAGKQTSPVSIDVADARTFVKRATVAGGLAAGVLTPWDAMRVRNDAVHGREWLDLAHMVADHIRREHEVFLGPRRKDGTR